MAPSTDPDGVPIFGITGTLTDTRDFAVEIYRVSSRATTQEYFTAWVDPGAGPVLAFMRANTETAEVAAAARLLYSALIDDDGLPETYQPPDDDDDDDVDVDGRLEVRDQWSSRRRFTTLIDDPDVRVAAALVVELAKWIVAGAFTRGATTPAGSPDPTPGPAPSPRGRTATRRGSTAKRSTAG